MKRICLAGNVRFPSERANSLQTASMAGAFAALGRKTTLIAARRFPPLADCVDPLRAYGLEARPDLVLAPCVDWIERVPTWAQFGPARVQEFTFARSAARLVARDFADAHVVVRDLEIPACLAGEGHESLWLELHRLPGGRIRRRLLRRALETVRGTIAISGGVRDDLVAFGADPEHIVVEHDAFDPGRFDGAPSREAARESLGLDAERPTVVYTGGLMAWKGVDLLVEAARSMPEVQFVLAGGMPADVERIRALARGLANVRIEGFRPPSAVPTYLAAADVGVVPNRSEPAIAARYTSPLKVFEAMALGLPLVAADLPALRDILTEAEVRFFAPDRADALAECLRAVLDDPALRASLSAAMLDRARAHTWKARASRLLEVFDAAPGESRSSGA